MHGVLEVNKRCSHAHVVQNAGAEDKAQAAVLAATRKLMQDGEGITSRLQAQLATATRQANKVHELVSNDTSLLKESKREMRTVSDQELFRCIGGNALAARSLCCRDLKPQGSQRQGIKWAL